MAELHLITDRSYGIIALRYKPNIIAPFPPPATTNTQILLIEASRRRPGNLPVWAIPKGHAESIDVSKLHTAIRELEEETSLSVKVENILKFKGAGDEVTIEGQATEEWDGSFLERYVTPGRTPNKEVRYWVAISNKEESEKELQVQKGEANAYKWYDWDEAIKNITFDEGRDMLKRVQGLLDGNVDFEVGIEANV